MLPEAVAWRVKRATGSAEGRDKGSLTLILLLWWTGIALDFSLSLLLPQAAISWKRIPVFFVGIGLMLLGIALRWYSAGILGKYFTFDIAIHGGQALIQAGPYPAPDATFAAHIGDRARRGLRSRHFPRLVSDKHRRPPNRREPRQDPPNFQAPYRIRAKSGERHYTKDDECSVNLIYGTVRIIERDDESVLPKASLCLRHLQSTHSS
jgi:hypothetical protein